MADSKNSVNRKTCLTCDYYDHEYGGLHCSGLCRRKSPLSDLMYKWPIVNPTHWCGEYSSKEDALENETITLLKHILKHD